MDTRSERYANNDTSSEEVFGSRTARNADLYREIREADVGNVDVRSNAKVIDNNSGNSIDVEHIKSILDTHYNDTPKIRTIPIEDTPKREDRVSTVFETTKEYDINSILSKAKEGREENYEEDRIKKLRDTQFDILSNLNINPKDYIEEYDDEDVKVEDTGISVEVPEDTGRTLQELIDTIALNEKQVRKEFNLDETSDITSDDNEDTDPLDIFEDLKGDDNTVTLDGLKEKTEALMLKMEEEATGINLIENDEDADEEEKKHEKTTSLDQSFFTTSTNFKKSDFESFEDLDEQKGLGPVAIIVIIILVLIFLAGVFFLVKRFL